MRLISTQEENKLWDMIKPYLRPQGLTLVFDENNAPENIKKAYEEYNKIHNKAYLDALLADGLI